MMSLKNNTKKVGFTLIELLIVVAIIGITASIMLVDWSGTRTTRYLDNSAREVESVVREAQNYALTGGGIAAIQSCGFLVGWEGSDYEIVYLYKDNQGGCVERLQLSRHTLTNGVVFPSSDFFAFTIPHGNVLANQTIVLEKLNSFRAVCVYTSGRILNVAGKTCP